MTDNQKNIIEKLFAGSFIAAHNGRYRVLDKARNPQLAFTTKTYKGIEKLLRKEKGLLVIDLRAVRGCRRNTWVKQYYMAKTKPDCIICDIKTVPEEGIIQFPDDYSDFFIREQYDGETKAVSIAKPYKTFFVKHPRKVIYFPNKKLN